MNDETFINRLARHILAHYDLKNEELTVVFPNKRAAYYLRSAFQNQIRENIWLPQMVSIQEAVTQWSDIQLVDNIDMVFELIDIDAELHPERQNELRDFGGQATQMAKDFDEIDQYDVDAKSLFGLVYDDKVISNWHIDGQKNKEKENKYLMFFASLYAYYTQLHDRLEHQGKGYYGMITRHLAHLGTEEICSRIDNRKVIFAGFNALTTTETVIMRNLVNAGIAEVIFDYDSYYVDDDNNEAGLFARRYLKSHPEWMKNGLTNRLMTEEKHIYIVPACGNTLQVKAMQGYLQQTDNPDSVVVLADENLLIPVLNSIPDSPTYSTLKVSMGYPMRATAVYQFVKEFFALVHRKKLTRKIKKGKEDVDIEGWYIWPIYRLFDLEILKAVFTDQECQFYTQWKIQAAQRGKFLFEEADFAEFEQWPDIQALLQLLLHTEADPRRVLMSLKGILSFLVKKIQKNKKKDELLFLLNQISEMGKAVNRLEQVVTRHENYIDSIDGLEALFRLISSEFSIRLNSSSTDGLQIMGLLETRNLDFETLHILSVNEGILPADKTQSSFIPQFIKRAFNLPGYQEKQAVFAYHFYRLLQSGKEIYLYYNSLAEDFGGEPSRFILQIQQELAAKNPKIVLTETSFDNRTSELGKSLKIWADKRQVMDKVIDMFSEKNGLSPTALSAYISCPLRFYMKYIEKIDDDSMDEETGSNVIGSITHKTLELLLQRYQHNPNGVQPILDANLFKACVVDVWEQFLDKAIEEELPSGLPDVGYNYLNKITIRKQLENYLQFMSKELDKGNMEIVSTEMQLNSMLDVNGMCCRIKGFPDRIDRYLGKTRIIDYKTGSVHHSDLVLPVQNPDEKRLDYLRRIPEKALQLLIYKYLYLKNNPKSVPQEVVAAIHGLKYPKDPEFTLSFKGAVTDETFLGDARFIDDMEAMLGDLVLEMADPQKPFEQCEAGQHVCDYCKYAGICKRTKE